MAGQFPYTVIAVGDRAVCIWDQELERHNADFCQSFHPDWFIESVASHVGDADTADDVDLPVALAIRQTYHHALETFFALLFALYQAPYCLPAWLELYEFSVLRDLIRAANHQAPTLNAWQVPHPTWENLAGLVTQFGWPDDPETTRRFGKLWRRLAAEYLDEKTAAEHAALKHGFRALPSGGGIKIGLEPEYGVSPPPEEMNWLGGSKHGSSTFIASPIPARTGRRKATHYHLKVQNVFWLLEPTILKVQHLSMSMRNVLAAARIGNGERAETIQFHRPADPGAFDAPWRQSTGVTGFSTSFAGPGESVTNISKEDVLARMKEASGLTADPEPGGTAT